MNLGRKDGNGRKTLHHGTMLIKTDPLAIQKYLNPNKLKLKSKGVDSVISRVENLSNIDKNITSNSLFEAIKDEFIKFYDGHEYAIEELDHSVLKQRPNIDKLFKEYSGHEWLYQNTPNFTNNIETRFDWGIMDVYFHVEKGIIFKYLMTK